MKETGKTTLPTRAEASVFRLKATLLQIKRGARNLTDTKLKKFEPQRNALIKKTVIGESKTPLRTESDPGEQFLLAGKIQNLRIAVKKLDGLEIPADAVFSFWKHIGRTTRRKGYVAGRELREGCIIPNIGGGLCQLSNALYDAALQANFEIIERHAHTRIIQGSLAEKGRDATVFWNYVDLRFKSSDAFRIEARLDSENLIVRFKSEKMPEKRLFQIATRNFAETKSSEKTGNCATCGVNDCFRVIKPSKETLNFGRTAFLLDEYMAEFDDYLQNIRTAKDSLFIPLDGKRLRKANYAWTTTGFRRVNQSLMVTAWRAYKSRKLAAQGASRQKNLLAMSAKLAESYAKNLSFDVLHLVIQQNLLPFLWESGVLGGRTFDVLMTALPMADLQKRLDFAKSLHPESPTLGDFRAENNLVKAEAEALQNARKIITPHTEIASLFPEKSELLNWKLPSQTRDSSSAVYNPKPKILFPASTVGRKGVYELRDALRGLDVKLMIQGAVIETPDFWENFDVERVANDAIYTADLVVLPAFVEHKPRLLLKAVALKVPVIASKACGAENVAGIETVKTGDAVELREKITDILFRNRLETRNIVPAGSEIFVETTEKSQQIS